MIRKDAPFSEAMRHAFFRVCVPSFAICDLAMRRSPQWPEFSIATLMFALAPFAQKEHVPIARISKSNSANERRERGIVAKQEKSYAEGAKNVG